MESLFIQLAFIIYLFIHFIIYSALMYKSQFQKLDPYDWFCDPGSQLKMTF